MSEDVGPEKITERLIIESQVGREGRYRPDYLIIFSTSINITINPRDTNKHPPWPPGAVQTFYLLVSSQNNQNVGRYDLLCYVLWSS